MSTRPQTYTERAHHCEQMAFRLRNAEAKSKFVQLARQWHARAAQEGEGQPVDAAVAAQG
jgi:predicted mannosyl-3-phosphoglycerate phosphatase (HAD superfamily)